MRSLSRTENILFFFLITTLAILMRILLFSFESCDYHQFLQGWYDTLKANGGFAAVGMDIGDYMPTYLYLLALFTYLPIPGLYAIKLISTVADLVLAVFVMKIVNLKYTDEAYGLTAYAVILLLPSVFLNSAVWGQCDAIFTSALIACVYYLMQGDDRKSMLAFSISFIFKLQAVFLAPFLLLMLIKQKIRPVNLLIIPLVYILSIIPAVIMGRSFWALLTVYYSLAGQYKMLAMFLPNLYTWLPEETPEYIGKAAVLLAGALVLLTLYAFCRKRFRVTPELFIALALFYALFVPYILPHMHERYNYLADILSVIYAFYFPRKYYVPVVTVLASTYAVCHNLFNTDFFSIQLLGVIMLGILILILKHTVELINENSFRKARVHT
jgi:Gpi18-like mannosyltransferase